MSRYKKDPTVDKQVNEVNKFLFGYKSTLTNKQKQSVFLEDVCSDPKKRGRKKGSKNTPKASETNFVATSTINIKFSYTM